MKTVPAPLPVGLRSRPTPVRQLRAHPSVPESTGYWERYRGAVDRALGALSVTNACGDRVEPELAMETLATWSRAVKQTGGTQYFVGNGASACMASHMALDWTKNGGVRSQAFNDPAYLTAFANDLGSDQMFAEPLRRFGRPGDLLVSISSSGNSPNVIRALEVARSQGLLLATFSGMKPDNASRRLGDLNFHIPAHTYGIVECTHQVLLHAWLDQHLGDREWEPRR